MCRISVVTICFDNPAELKKTCQSVDAQSSPPFEHWIIDGSRSSAIADWLNKTPQPPYRKWISEPDKGIADAFNKGILRCSGDLVQLLNSADVYASDMVLEKVAKTIGLHPSAQWLTGKIWMIRLGKQVLVGKPFDPQKLYRGMRSVSHPTWFVKRSVYAQLGDYSLQFKIAMDYDMMCRLKDYKSVFLDDPLVIFDDSGLSTHGYMNALKETRQVYQAQFGYSLPMELWQCRLKLLYGLQHTVIGRFLFLLKRKLGMENL